MKNRQDKKNVKNGRYGKCCDCPARLTKDERCRGGMCRECEVGYVDYGVVGRR